MLFGRIWIKSALTLLIKIIFKHTPVILKTLFMWPCRVQMATLKGIESNAYVVVD